MKTRVLITAYEAIFGKGGGFLWEGGGHVRYFWRNVYHSKSL